MEVMQTNVVAKEKRGSVGPMVSAGRLALLAGVLLVGGHCYDSSRPARDKPADASAPCDACEDPWSLEDGSSLVGRRLRVRREGSRTLIAHVFREHGAMGVEIDGMRFGLKELAGIAVGKHVDDVTVAGDGVRIVSDDYGTADVSRDEIETAMHTLARSTGSGVTVDIEARFDPVPNTVLSASVATKRYFSGWNGEAESFGVAFVRETRDDALAMRGK